jgi:YD repeat-containing protein
MQLRDSQVGALRRGYVARRICEQLEQAGGQGRFEPATGVVHATDPVGCTSRLQIGLDGLPEAHTTPLGRLSRLKYNKHALLTEQVEASGRCTQLTYDDERAPTLFSRDGVELARFHWNAAHTENAIEFWDGSRASSSFSAAGKPLRLTNRAGISESFTYDARNRLVALKDGRGNQTRFSYDEQGRPATTRYSDNRAETAQYDAVGSWSGTLLNGKLVFEREADAANRPLAVTYADGRKEGFAYDDQGRLIGAEGPEGALAFGYDDRGNVVSETCGDQAFKFKYDASGLLTAIDYPGGCARNTNTTPTSA